ncbi:MAG: oxysterol-binding protein [Amphiamblys sp. WSBS2006]|nr:MAG: oxysterol-binding protein [Amphiamblys sp. WSBS2006]
MEYRKIGKKEVFSREIEIDVPGTLLSWDFYTEHRRIGFGLYFRPHGETDCGELEKPGLSGKQEKGRASAGGKDLVEILPTSNVKASRNLVSGEHKTHAAGLYVFRFDNSFSRNTKRLHYLVQAADTQKNRFFAGKVYLNWTSGFFCGWSRKWAVLHESGLLELKTPTNSHTRKIDLNTASPILETRKNGILILTPNNLLRLKVRKADEYSKWAHALSPWTEKSGVQPPTKPCEAETTDDEDVFYDVSEEETTPGRRRKLPCFVQPRNISMASLIPTLLGSKKGSLPIEIFEPLSGLQKLCEEIEYIDLVRNALGEKDARDMLPWIALFALSGCASLAARTGKPFNPILGETFEYTCKDLNIRFVGEKVSHRPLVFATHTECLQNTFTMWTTCTTHTNTSFSGIELVSDGETHLVLNNTQDHFVWSRSGVKTKASFSSKKSLGLDGVLEIRNLKTDDSFSVCFQKKGLFGSQKNAVSGAGGNGRKEYAVTGQWDSAVQVRELATERCFVWTKNSPVQHAEAQFGFTAFAVSLNEVTDDLFDKDTQRWNIPPTDSRHRRDIRLLEEGEFKEAAREKERAEKIQRENTLPGKHTGKWFAPSVSSGGWEFTGRYWDPEEKTQ